MWWNPTLVHPGTHLTTRSAQKPVLPAALGSLRSQQVNCNSRHRKEIFPKAILFLITFNLF